MNSLQFQIKMVSVNRRILTINLWLLVMLFPAVGFIAAAVIPR